MSTQNIEKNKINGFWKKYDDKNIKKESQLEIYTKNDASEDILRFVKLGGGPALGSISEQYAKHTFSDLKERLKGETSHDHTIEIDGKIIKIEQKTSTLNKKRDFMWQHVAEKHPWDILLLMGVHYKEIVFYGCNKEIFGELVNQGKITNQGSKNKDSEQGLWFNFSNVKDDLIKINTNEDIKKLLLVNNKQLEKQLEKQITKKIRKSSNNNANRELDEIEN